MTLIYERPFAAPGEDVGLDELPEDAPALHALVLGIGRFPNLPPSRDADRQACVDSAKAMVEFLTEHADKFEAPLASIECLISDPNVGPGGIDRLEQTHERRDPRDDNEVSTGTLDNVKQACKDWLSRCRKDNGLGQAGDQLLLYICSHGVAGRDAGALAVLEDVEPDSFSPWSELLDVGSMASDIPAVCGPSAVWIFLDACQEVLDEIVDLVGGHNAHKPVVRSIRQVTDVNVTSLAVVGSRFGDFAHAPMGGGVAYFTQALIKGVSQSCVQEFDEVWYSTAKEIPGGVVKVAKSVSGRVIHTETLRVPTYDSALMKVDNPHIPIGIVSDPTGILLRADSAKITQSGQEIVTRPDSDVGESWHLSLPIGFDRLDLVLESPNRAAPIIKSFRPQPPAQWIKVSNDE